jgi:hypothetical protein
MPDGNGILRESACLVLSKLQSLLLVSFQGIKPNDCQPAKRRCPRRKIWLVPTKFIKHLQQRIVTTDPYCSATAFSDRDPVSERVLLMPRAHIESMTARLHFSYLPLRTGREAAHQYDTVLFCQPNHGAICGIVAHNRTIPDQMDRPEVRWINQAEMIAVRCSPP